MSTAAIDRLRSNIQNVFLGNPAAVDLLLVGLLARGHVLIEDVPGVGKTVLAKSLAKSIACDFNRIQFTPDMLPADVLGVTVFNRESNHFDFKPGPVFTNILLADEINRTTPRTQSALLEAMSEEQVSVETHTYTLKRPFMVVATQNPFEFEGTYHLPENQLDRFVLKIGVGYPSRASEYKILTTRPGQGALDNLKPVMSGAEVIELQDKVPHTKMDNAIVDYMLDLIVATRNHDQLHLGISTRGAGANVGGTGARGASWPRLRDSGRCERAVHRLLRPPRDQQDVPQQRRRGGYQSHPASLARPHAGAEMIG
ncbi:MAG: AAA family ATPase [Tepidisphaeraceae bacterium]